MTGGVQGVGFRWSAREAARRFGVTGWARNRLDGSVEAEIQGDPDRVERMLDWLRTGPPGASVQAVEVTDAEPQDDDAFRIRETV